ncbi:MAG: lysophospholipid acyltransferase family protein [Rikenellaceae bacterium]
MFSIFASVLGYLFLTVLCSVFLIISAVAFVVCYPFDPKRWVVHNLSRAMSYIFFFVFRWMWQYEISGLENIDPKGRYVIMMNHNAMMDVPMLYFTSLDFRWVSKRQVFSIPFFGQFLVLHGDIAIERGNPAAAMKLVMERGLKWIGRGVSVSIFPEGTRSKTGEIGRFKSGGFRLAQEAGVEILPVVVDGTKTLLKSNGLLNPGRKIIIKVLPAVSAQRVAQTDVKVLMDEVHQDMVDGLAQIRANKNK